MTKQRDIIKRIGREAARQGLTWEFDRQGGNHEVWKLDGLMIPIARHREIPELTTRDIYRECEPKFGKDWWK
ncbi:hypothetical protein ACIRON_02805 [Nocardioides sp. NPDC101246]|uniref:hypothetical protein n=1 Tax=Nocardioides sp. NPDC101246 TaxID=3364336 RepID=UPI00381B6D6E